ncbi:MAG TPA: exodeoxyribonuclease VII small subunit [Verrucomicrobiae bacterium]|nr:exodeoxyribonuclease VII small subunit [Verrucomicrobiae bacterium]
MPDKQEPAIEAMSFEEALTELQGLVKALEKGEAKLDEAIRAYERGAALKQHCERKLREAQAKVDKIVVGADGSLSSEPVKFD